MNMKKILILTMILSGVVTSCKKVSAECKEENIDVLTEKKGLLSAQYDEKKKALENDQEYYKQRKMETYPDPQYKDYNDSVNMVKEELEVLKTKWKLEDDKLASEISGLFDRCENLVAKGK